MVAKIIEGKSFGGCARYLLKGGSEIISTNGLRTTSAKTIVQDFNLQRKLNPRLGKAVGHIVLAWSERDSYRLTNELMEEVALKYLGALGIRDTQYLMVRHRDRRHDHMHIVYNRVNDLGKTIPNNNLRFKSVKVCKQLNGQFGFYQAHGKEWVNRGRLKGADKAKYEIYDALQSALQTSKNWQELENYLKYRGVTIQFKRKANSGEIQGVSFAKNGYTFRGSEVDRSLSYGKIDRLFHMQEPQNSIQSTIKEPGIQPHEPALSEIAASETTFPWTINIAYDQDDEAVKRKKKKKIRRY